MKWKRLGLLFGVVGTAVVAGLWLAPHRPRADIPATAQPVPRPPRIHPDYCGLVVPPNLAPLNFRIEESGDAFLVRIRSSRGTPVEVFSRSADIKIPVAAWRRLLTANRGELLSLDVFVRRAGNDWQGYRTITHEIAHDEIDSFLAYRLLRPHSASYRDIGVYQRNLETYEESVLLHASSYKNGCVNCHTFLHHDPDNMLLGVRSPVYGDATVLVTKGEVRTIGTRFGHTAWHPSGRVAAFSRFDIRLFYHTARVESRDALEFDSLLAYYRFDSKTVRTAPPIADKGQLETQPTWSPDGRYLYFVSAPKLWGDSQVFPPERFADVKYDLKRVRYDVATDHWGTVETVLSAERTGKSILTPRFSPDGRFLLFCMCDHGCFALYQPDSDLYLMDMDTGDYRRLDCNSPFPESWHAWSSNGRWIVFSSKRPTGLFTRLYFCHVDAAGRVSKPFVLPQRDPGFYDSFVHVYNVPEFIREPVQTSTGKLIHAVRDAGRIRVDAVTMPTRTVPDEDDRRQEQE